MTIRRLFQHAIILGYLTVTASAFLYTMTRIRTPGIPGVLLNWSYGMMAPYQGDNEWNVDIVARGRRPSGEWVPVDLDAYIGAGFGERNVRKFMRVFGPPGSEERRGAFRQMAEKLLVRERAAERAFSSIRMLEQKWPRSPGGFNALRREPFMKEVMVVEVY